VAGLVADIGGWAMQAWALATGALIVVQPLIALNLVFALAIAAALSDQPIRRDQWVAVAATLIGLAIFLTLARPTEHSDAVATESDWLILALITTCGVAVLLSAGRARLGAQRAALFGAAAGAAEALMAVLSKAFADRVGKGFASTFASWEPYAVIGCGILTMLVVQSAYQVGQPTVSLPVNTVAEPVLAASVGAALFGEHLRVSGARIPLVAMGLALMATGLVALARTSASAEELSGLQGDGMSAA
jgi:drug/metabolite transporter (DMT)-like permease